MNPLNLNPSVVGGFLLFTLSGGPLLAASDSQTPVPGKVFAQHFQALPPVGDDQVQVVYYRQLEGVQRKGSAHVYVDREFHSGLLPGGYTRFCLAPGVHILGAYIGDAPHYTGKSTDLYQALLTGGSTYYLRVREDESTFPIPVKREEAEAQLLKARAQVHALSRASAVEACRNFDFIEDKERYKHYQLSSDVLFAFGKGAYEDISVAGRAAVRDWITQLQRDDAQISHIRVEGHTDPLGEEARNQLLGLQRADSVRQLLIEQGLPESIISAESMGNREPLIHSCYGPLAQQVACYAPNRRVELRVELSHKAP